MYFLQDKETRQSEPCLIINSEKSLTLLPDTLAKRNKIAKERILNLINEHHKKYIDSTGNLQLKNYDPFKVKCWHHLFNVHTIPHIPEAALPPKPSSNYPESLMKYMDEINIKEKNIQKEIEKLTKEIVIKETKEGLEVKAPEVKANIKNTNISEGEESKSNLSLITEISPDLLNKIRAKEKANRETENIINERNNESKAKNYQNPLVPFAQQLIGFSFTNWKSLQMEEICNKIDMPNKLNGQKNEYVKNKINELISKVPEWITIIETGNRKIIKFNKEMSTAEIINKLQNS